MIFKDDTFTLLIYTGIILTGGTVSIYALKPDDTQEIWTGSVATDPKYISYLVQAGDFDQEGIYWLRGHISRGSLNKLGDWIMLTVEPRW